MIDGAENKPIPEGNRLSEHLAALKVECVHMAPEHYDALRQTGKLEKRLIDGKKIWFWGEVSILRDPRLPRKFTPPTGVQMDVDMLFRRGEAYVACVLGSDRVEEQRVGYFDQPIPTSAFK